MPQFALGEEVGWTTLHRGTDGSHWDILVELQGQIIDIGCDRESGEVRDYLIEATIRGRPVGSVRIPAAEASALSTPPTTIWCAEFT
ncbi:hypothetical protein ACWF9G_27230 [Nocardia sp. NPDC055029]